MAMRETSFGDEYIADACDLSFQQARPRSFWGWVAAQFARMRFQLFFGYLFAVVAPAIVRPNMEVYPDPIVQYDNSLYGTSAAFLLGYFIFRKLTAFPGVRASGYVLPAFAISYAGLGLLFWLLRLDYSRYQFLTSFLVSAVFFYVVFFIARRGKRLSLAIVPGGQVERLLSLSFVDWRPLRSPDDLPASVPLVADLRADLGEAWERLIADSVVSGRPVYDFKAVMESLSGRVQVEHLSENTFGSLIPNTMYASAKRYMDVVLAIVSLIQLAPIFLVVGFLIKRESPGPAYFTQTRMGYRGKPFTVVKFRTMRAAPAPGDASQQMTLPDDARITKLGRFLRRTRIDELPQIINILKGDMSWIGPRPEAMGLSALYESQIPFYRYRHAVRPGITGWAQVNQGHVTSVADVDVKLQYDFYYVKNFSFWLDLMVIFKTLIVVLTGKGAK